MRKNRQYMYKNHKYTLRAKLRVLNVKAGYNCAYIVQIKVKK